METRAGDAPAAINVMIVDPDAERRERLIACLSCEEGFQIVGVGDDFLDTCQMPFLRHSPVDVLLIDVDQSEMADIETWAAIHFLLPGARIVALTEGNDDLILEAALGAGVTGLHRPDAESGVLCRAVRNAVQGMVDHDPWLTDRARCVLMRPLKERQVRFGESTIDHQTQEVTRWGWLIHLTQRECEVLALLGHGLSNRQIAARLHISEKTVRNCVSEILSKLGLSNRTQAALWAKEHGLVGRE